MPNSTQVPDVLLDHWLSRLPLAELRVLLYITRRTFGFGKSADAISLRQICEGVRRRDGTVLDEGTGLSRKAVSQAVQDLEKRGLLRVSRQVAPDGENRVNIYQLVLDGQDGYGGSAPQSDPRASHQPIEQAEGVGTYGTYGSVKSTQGGRYRRLLGVGTTGTPQHPVIQDPEKQQHPARRRDVSLPETDTPRGESDVVVPGLIGTRSTSPQASGAPQAPSKTASGVAPVTPPTSAVEVEAFGLADLTNELVTRGVSLPAAQKWLHKRPPEYIRQLLEYHDWCQEHRKGFIHDSGAWLAASLATPIPIPEQYLKAKARAHGKAEQDAREAEEQARREAEEVRRRATELALDPREWARRRLQTYEDSQQLLGKPPLTEPQRQEREAQYTTSWIRQREEFIAEHPEFADLVGRPPGATGDASPAPDEALEATTQAQLKAWQQERQAAREEQSLQNAARRLARSPEERAEDALRGLDENADALGRPRLRGTARAERRRELVAQFQTEQRTGEPSPAPSWKAPEGRLHGANEQRRPNDQPAPKNALSTPLRAAPTALQIAERSGQWKGRNGSVTTSRVHRPPGLGRCRNPRGVP